MKPLGIAIAEDDWFLGEYLCGELAALGHAVVGRARTGDELINLVVRERPDLVLVDVRLADGSDGLAAAKENPGAFRHTGGRHHRTSYRCRRRSSGTLEDLEQAVHLAELASGPRGGGSMAGERLEQTLPEALIPVRRAIRHVESRTGFCLS
jgi:hypothetical protein